MIQPARSPALTWANFLCKSRISFAPRYARLPFIISMQKTAMTDPILHDHWIDALYPFASPTDPPDDVDKALDALADAIARANDGERRSMASHLARTPAVSKTAKVLSQLTASRLIAFLERHSGLRFRGADRLDARNCRVRRRRSYRAGAIVSAHDHGSPALRAPTRLQGRCA